MHHEKPLPKPNAETKPFWEGCRKHELKFQKCPACDHVRWPPSIVCPKCHSPETGWIKACGRGRVYSYAVYHTPFHPAFREEIPYVTAVIELEEGPRFLTNIVECDPGDVRCDMPVEVLWEDVTDEISLPKFRPFKCVSHSVCGLFCSGAGNQKKCKSDHRRS
jgi:uncharacterized OB-fold protein